jgi:flagellar biosynthetic protein FliR
MEIIGFGMSQITTFLLVLARVGGIFTTAPLMSNVHLSPMVRVATALALTFVFVPMVHYDATGFDMLRYLVALTKEIAIGLAMGFLVSLMFAAIQMAGAYVDLQVGFGFAQIVDPMSNEQNAVMGQFQNLVATLLFLSINGHHMMIRGLADSFAVVPIGEVVFSPTAAGGIMKVFAIIFIAALKIGAPVVGAIFLTDVALGILARTVPQLNVFVVGFPAKIMVGYAVMLAVLPIAFAVMNSLFGGMHRDLVALLRLLRA